MLSATRRWFRRNRTPVAIGVGVVGAGYLATQYVLNKINDARERMSSDRIAKENLRRRFEQNQEDCTFTVLALLPTATANILEAMNTERITLEIQQMKSAAKSTRSGEANATPPSIADTTLTEGEEGKSVASASLQSESGVHASQMTLPPSTSQTGDGGAQDGGQTTTPAPAPKPRRTKRQLWDDLTISSITRAITLVYTLALLTMLTRVQLNLLGRRSYLSSVISLATGTAQSTISLENNDGDDPEHQVYGCDFDINRKYLTFSWWLLNKGWEELGQRVEEAVRDVFGHLSPRDLLSYDTFTQLTLEVRKKIEGGSDLKKGERRGSKWLSIVLPPREMEDHVLRESGVLGESATAETQGDGSSSGSSSASLRRLLDETSDLIESPAFSHVLTLVLDAGFSVLHMQKLLPGAFELPAIPEVGDLSEQSAKVVLLPKILSVLTRQAHAIGHGMMPNEYLQAMEQVPDLEAFAAVVYSSNWENEIQNEGEDEGLAAVSRSQSQSSTLVPSSVQEGSTSRMTTGVTTAGAGEESMVLVEPEPEPSQISFESVWEKASQQQEKQQEEK
ncbi:peroxisomal biogenesis factor 3 [Apiospora marii]|uniref:Peroxisomal biogenesis factor 3 n=1 Tax=Apiospora marii TaxID=335849 RepID=A0ABR1S5J9_9PEZI